MSLKIRFGFNKTIDPCRQTDHTMPGNIAYQHAMDHNNINVDQSEQIVVSVYRNKAGVVLISYEPVH